MRIGDREFEMSYTRATGRVAGNRRDLERNLRTLVEQARRGGTRLILMSYPARHEFYERTNPIIWEVAEETGTPLVNLTELFAPLCPELECPTHLTKDNHHPNRRGYRLIGRTVATELRDLMP